MLSPSSENGSIIEAGKLLTISTVLRFFFDPPFANSEACAVTTCDSNFRLTPAAEAALSSSTSEYRAIGDSRVPSSTLVFFVGVVWFGDT